MPLIDEDGSLFGVINVVDAVVLLVVLAVVTGGVWVVATPEEDTREESDTPDASSTVVTLSIGDLPRYIADEISAGDTFSPGGRDRLTVTDVFLSPRGDAVRVVLRAQLRGVKSGSRVVYQSETVRVGRELQVSTTDYEVSGFTTATNQSKNFTRESVLVTVTREIGAEDTGQLSPGDNLSLGGQPVLTVENVTYQPTGDPERRLAILTFELSAARVDGELRFGGNPVTRGGQLSFVTDGVSVAGEIQSVGEPQEQSTTRVALSTTVSAEAAPDIDAGDTVQIGGQRPVVVRNVTYQPTEQSGEVRVLLTADIQTVSYNGVPQFGGTPVTRGQTTTFAVDGVEVSGQIERVGRAIEREESRVILQTRVDSDVARQVTENDTVRVGGETVAEVVDVLAYDTARSDERFLVVETRVTGIRRADGTYFGGQRIQTGNELRLQTANYTLDGQIDSVGESLVTTETKVLVRAFVDTERVDKIVPGREIRVAGRVVGTVQNVTVYDTEQRGTKRLLLGVSLQTRQQPSGPQFGTTTVRSGADIDIRTHDYVVSGQIERVGTTELRGEPGTRTVTVKLSRVNDHLAESIRSSLQNFTETSQVADVVGVDVEPTELVATTSNGSVVVNEHPTLREVTVRLELRTRSTDAGLLFKQRELRVGETITLDFGVVKVEAVVERIAE